MKKLLGFILVLAMLLSAAAFAEAGETTIHCPRHLKDGVVCMNCYWNGAATYNYTNLCFHCNGGIQKCYWCEGKGYSFGQKCSVCHGEKVLVCKSCNGTGKGKTTTNNREWCPDCGRNEETVCFICCNQDGRTLPGITGDTCAFSYREIMRTPDEKIGQDFTVSGTVKSIDKMCDGVYYIILQHISGEIEYEVHLRYFSEPGDSIILVGDKINAYGTYVSYNQNNTPAFVIVDVTIENMAS